MGLSKCGDTKKLRVNAIKTKNNIKKKENNNYNQKINSIFHVIGTPHTARYYQYILLSLAFVLLTIIVSDMHNPTNK